MRQHVLDLCDQHEIEIEWIDRGGWAARELDLIQIPPIRSAISYAVALHEIGHICGRYQTSKAQTVRERWAWVWAREKAVKWTASMDRKARASLVYAARAGGGA